MNANKLSLNISKSNVILINEKDHDKKHNDNLVKFLSYIPILKTSKYLDIFYDTLFFQYHIQNLVKNLSRSVRILAKVKSFLNAKALLNLDYANFHSHLQ